MQNLEEIYPQIVWSTNLIAYHALAHPWKFTHKIFCLQKILGNPQFLCPRKSWILMFLINTGFMNKINSWLKYISQKRSFFFKIKVRTTCDKECIMAARVPHRISFYYISNERLLNKLSCSIKYVLMYTGTHLTQSNEPCMLWCGGIKAM